MWSSAEHPAPPGPLQVSDACCTDSSVIDTHPGQCKVMSIRERERKCRKDDMEKPSSMDTEALCQLEESVSVEKAQASSQSQTLALLLFNFVVLRKLAESQILRL